MPSITSKEEELNRLYVAYQNISKLPIAIGLAVLALANFINIFLPRNFSFWWTIPILVATVYFPVFFTMKRKEEIWLKNLTKEEKDLLARAAIPLERGIMSGILGMLDPSKPAREIMKAYKKWEVNAEKELLRASNPAPADELLRSTTAHTKTPKDELLRSTTHNPQ